VDPLVGDFPIQFTGISEIQMIQAVAVLHLSVPQGTAED